MRFSYLPSNPYGISLRFHRHKTHLFAKRERTLAGFAHGEFHPRQSDRLRPVERRANQRLANVSGVETIRTDQRIKSPGRKIRLVLNQSLAMLAYSISNVTHHTININRAHHVTITSQIALPVRVSLWLPEQGKSGHCWEMVVQL